MGVVIVEKRQFEIFFSRTAFFIVDISPIYCYPLL